MNKTEKLKLKLDKLKFDYRFYENKLNQREVGMFNWIVMWFLIIITLVAVFISNTGILVILCTMLIVGVVGLVKINARKEKPLLEKANILLYRIEEVYKQLENC